MSFPSHDMPLCKCFVCESELNKITAADGTNGLPKPGDITICLRCGHLMAFRKNLTVRPLNDKETQRAKDNPRIQKLLAVRIITRPPLH